MVDEISIAEVRTAIRRMMKGKALGPDDIPVEAWLCLGNRGIEFLTRVFNRLLCGEKMPDEWRESVLVSFFKGKGDIKECGNYRGIKLTSHTMKLWERVIEARLRKEMRVAEQQYSGLCLEGVLLMQYSVCGCCWRSGKKGRRGCTVCLWISKRPMIGCRGKNYGSVYAWPKHWSAM